VRTIATSVKAKLGASFKASQRTVTAYFVQRMFTVSISLPQLPASLFSEDFTADLLAEHVERGDLGPDNPPVYVANVVYGRILIFSLTSMESELKIRAALNASFASTVKTDISAEYLKLLEESAINVVAVGGDGQNALQLIQSGDSPGVRIQGDVWDQDGGLLGGPDLMARFTRDEHYPNVGVGERMLPIGVNGCAVRLYFTVDHLGDAPPPPAPPAGQN
jgi:hypothetical protein